MFRPVKLIKTENICFWVFIPCSLISLVRSFWGKCCFHLQGADTSTWTSFNHPEDWGSTFLCKSGTNTLQWTLWWLRITLFLYLNNTRLKNPKNYVCVKKLFNFIYKPLFAFEISFTFEKKHFSWTFILYIYWWRCRILCQLFPLCFKMSVQC
jgi:hypothetical protein